MRLQVVLAALFLSGVAVGCAEVIGLQKREGPDGSGGGNTGGGAPTGPIDEETGKATSEDCIEYCDAIEANCPEGTQFQQYPARENCINSCNAFEPGERSEPLGNTVACRLRQAKAASNSSGEFCGSAGPLGGGECGSNCDAWCTLLEAACPDDYDVLADCKSSCSGLKDSGNLNFQNSYPSAPDLQCRVYHAGAALENPTVHCPHARYLPASTCVETERDPTCDEYCSKAMANCRPGAGTEQDPNRKVYDSKAECLAACSAFPIGKMSDTTDNTLGCRIYHAGASATSPAVHCSHASPSGDGHCGLDGEEGTGNCDSYCLLYQKGCSAEFAAEHGGQAACVTTCSADFADRGALKDRGYSVASAPAADNLQCRVYYATKAAAGDDSVCERASLASDSCVE